jgi:hypothetical protein
MMVAPATPTVARLVPVTEQAGGASPVALDPSSNNDAAIISRPRRFVHRPADPGGDLNEGEVS